jgi:hypothetical protein
MDALDLFPTCFAADTAREKRAGRLGAPSTPGRLGYLASSRLVALEDWRG